MICIIAGTGNLPLEAARFLKENNKTFFALSLFPEDNGEALKEILDGRELVHHEYCKVSDILDALKERNTTHVVLIGKVDKGLLLKKVKLDWLAIKLLSSVMAKSDKNLMEKVLSFLAEHNIQVIPQHEVLGSLLVKPGVLCGSADDYITKNTEIGLKVAQQLSNADIGQTIVIKDEMVLALEAIEGTDKCVQRGIELGGGERIVICKATRKDHNKKYDLPTIGPKSIEFIKPGQVCALAWQSSHTLIAEKEKLIAMAQERGITLISV
jgi:DUF1009 family protein